MAGINACVRKASLIKSVAGSNGPSRMTLGDTFTVKVVPTQTQLVPYWSRVVAELPSLHAAPGYTFARLSSQSPGAAKPAGAEQACAMAPHCEGSGCP